jgi:hypothetical protein
VKNSSQSKIVHKTILPLRSEIKYLISFSPGFAATLLCAESTALRHQLSVLQPTQKGSTTHAQLHRPLPMGWLSRVWSGWRSALIIVKPETVIGWHHQPWLPRGSRYDSVKLSPIPHSRARLIMSRNSSKLRRLQPHAFRSGCQLLLGVIIQPQPTPMLFELLQFRNLVDEVPFPCFVKRSRPMGSKRYS